MNGPLVLTDKETILVLRARIAELEAEVKAWEAFDKESAASADQVEQVAALRPQLRRGDKQAGGLATAHVLVLLLAHPGQPVSRERLYICCQAANGRGAREDGRALAVRFSRLRAALANLGLPGIIHYEQGSGWMITRTGAENVRGVLLDGCNPPGGCNTLLVTVDA